MKLTLASHHGGGGLRLWVSGVLPSVCEALGPHQNYGNKTKLPWFLIRGSSFTFHQGVKIQA